MRVFRKESRWITRVTILAWALLLSWSALAPALVAQPDRWESAIRTFKQADRLHPPPQHAVLFAGSSSIRKWESLEQDFPFVPTIRRGFGGSQMADLLFYADSIVIPYDPAVVIVYEGDNDIAAGKTPEQMFEDYKAFVQKVETELPDTRIGFIAIKPSLARWDLVDQMARANRLIRQYTLWKPNLEYIDVFAPMLGIEGKPRAELLLEDGLHLTPAGYALWTEIVTPFVRAAMNQLNPHAPQQE